MVYTLHFALKSRKLHFIEMGSGFDFCFPEFKIDKLEPFIPRSIESKSNVFVTLFQIEF